MTASASAGPRISIVTVSFNAADCIGDALRSVATQTYPNVEHIVVDGGSRDDTLGVIERHGAHVAKLVSEPDRGIYDAMNKGLRLVSGDYVGFLNSDDMLASPDVIARYVEASSEAPDALYADLDYVRAERPDTVVRHWRSGTFSRSRLKFGWMPPHPTFYLERSLLQDVGDFDTNLHIAADYDFMLRCLTRPGFRARHVPQVAVKMRLGGVSNRSVQAMMRKSSEDLLILQRHGVGGWPTLACKNLRKIGQFVPR